MCEIAVTGMGVICAQGMNLIECKERLYGEVLPPLKPKRFETKSFDYPIFDLPKEIDEIFGIPSKNFNVFLSSLMAAKATEEALNWVNLDLDYLKDKKIAIVLGTTIGVTLNDLPFHRDFVEGKSPHPKPFEVFLNSNPSNFLLNFLKNKNKIPITIATACASGADAIGVGFLILKNYKDIDFVICGGTDEVSVVNHQGFISMHIYSKEPCKPFDKERNGLNLGNGAGILILEREGDAKKRGLNPNIFISGYGSYQDGYHFTHPHPEGEGLKRAILKAISYKNIKAEDIDFINAHGTATIENDKTEAKVIKSIFGEKAKFLSTKGCTGHTLGAAGAIEAVFSLLMLKEGLTSKSFGFKEVDPEIGIIPTLKNEKIEKRFCLSTSMGFAGANSALIFERKDL